MSFLDGLFAPAVAIAVDGASLRITQYQGRRVLSWSVVPLDPRFVRGGTIVNPQAVGKAIKDALKELGLTGRNVTTALPGVGVSSRIIQAPTLSSSDTPQFVAREARRTMAYNEETSYLFWTRIKKGKVGPVQLLAVAVPKESLASLFQAFKVAGKRVRVIDFKPLALARAVNQPDAIVVNAEANTIEIVIVVNDVPVLHRGVLVPEGQLVGDYGRARLVDEVVKTVTYYNDSHRDEPLATDVALYLSGEASLQRGLAEALTDATGHPVAAYRPVVACPNGLPVPLFTTNIGLVLK